LTFFVQSQNYVCTQKYFSPISMIFGVFDGLRFEVWGLRFGVWGLGFGVWGIMISSFWICKIGWI